MRSVHCKPTNPSQTDTEREARRAVDEAARTGADLSRRTAERAKEATRTLMDQSAEASRQLFGSWTASGEAAWRAAFELQNAQVRAGLSLLEGTANTLRAGFAVLQQWDEVRRQAQQAQLETFRVGARVLQQNVAQGAAATERVAR